MLLFATLLLVASGFLAWQGILRASVQVEWSTASELNTAGFNLYRSPQPGGTFERVNPSLIPAKGDPLAGGDYTYMDEPVQPGQVYYYQLEEVELDGSTGRYGPISVRAKIGAPFWAAAILLALALALLVVWLRQRGRHQPRQGEQLPMEQPDIPDA